MECVSRIDQWRSQARETLQSLGVVLPAPTPTPPPQSQQRGRPGLRPPIWRRPRSESRLPRGVAHVRVRRERVGLDLICNTCEHYISKSDILRILCHFYVPDGRYGSRLTRCYVRCPNCYDDIELGRNIGDAGKFLVIGGATQHFPASESAPKSEPDLRNEAYPDTLLDSPNDVQPRVVRLKEVEPPLSDEDEDEDDDVDVDVEIDILNDLRFNFQLLDQMS